MPIGEIVFDVSVLLVLCGATMFFAWAAWRLLHWRPWLSAIIGVVAVIGVLSLLTGKTGVWLAPGLLPWATGYLFVGWRIRRGALAVAPPSPEGDASTATKP